MRAAGYTRDVPSIIDEIRSWFEACDYLVTEEVGAAPGTVDRFATPRQGLMPPRTWWTVVPRFPEDLADANATLDVARRERGADRALAIVTDDAIPLGYHPDLNTSVVGYIPLRYLALTLTGVLARLDRTMEATSSYFPYRVREEGSSESFDACERIDAWIADRSEARLELRGTPKNALLDITREVARRRAERFTQDPERVVPVIWSHAPEVRAPAQDMLLERRWVVRAFVTGQSVTFWRLSPWSNDITSPPIVGELTAPTVQDGLDWLHGVLDEARGHVFREWLVRDESSRRLLLWSTFREGLRSTARKQATTPDGSWLHKVLSGAFQLVLDEVVDAEDAEAEVWDPVEEYAFRLFALGEVEPLRSSDPGIRALRNTGLVSLDEGSRGLALRYGFSSTCVRDWFIARKIAREVRAGNRDILSRYVLPRLDVGMFLAVIAPDVAALASSDRSEELRREVEGEVARRVELTLGHQLNRSIGTLSTHVNTVRRALREPDLDERTRAAFARIDEELEHLRKLTDRSRLLNESREWEVTSLRLSDVLTAVLDPLRERHGAVTLESAVPEDMTVRAAADGLREILHCIVENAFHSACALPEGRPRKIEIAAAREGETICVRIRDNGIGVRPEDRERIFVPFVTTKTGGPGKPRGTGLGLSIARTFAERMGAKVALESSNGETVFVVILVAGD